MNNRERALFEHCFGGLSESEKEELNGIINAVDKIIGHKSNE